MFVCLCVRPSVCLSVRRSSVRPSVNIWYTLFCSAHIFSMAYHIFFIFALHILRVNTFTVDMHMSRSKVRVKGQIDILSECIHFGIRFFTQSICSQWLILSTSYLLCTYLRPIPSQWIYVCQGQSSWSKVK